MSQYYLIDGSSETSAIRLVLYDATTEELRVIRDDSYKPHFFLGHPLTPEDETSVRGLNGSTRTVEKRDLFSGERRKLTRVEYDDPSLLPAALNQFKKRWEARIPYILSYAYDYELVFGAPYRLDSGKLELDCEIDAAVTQRFQEKFSETKKNDPQKYEILEKWFILCSQPIPKVPLSELGVHEALDYGKLYVGFLLSRVANLPLPMALTNRHVSAWVKSILHSYLRRQNVLIPSAAELRRGEDARRVPGALTFPPKTGTYFNTVVVDFESLYPSVIDSYNLSYETVDCGHTECSANSVPGADHYVCVGRRGVYSILTGALKDLRIHWFKPLSRDSSVPEGDRRLAEAASRLLKLILVSSYGVTVRIPGLAQPALAESITAYGRYALRQSWDLAERHEMRPLYGDTDSLFLDDPTEGQVNWLIRTVKEQLRLDLAVDKVYSVCVLPRAMKAYFGIGKDGTPDIKGVSAIKSNSPPFIKNVFMDCVEELANVKNWAEFEAAKANLRRVVSEAVGRLEAGKVPLDELAYSVKLHFDPAERPAKEETLHQPYQCAVQIADQGRKVSMGDTVSFVKVEPFSHGGRTFTVKPVELMRGAHEINVRDYVRNLRTALSQTFKPMNISFMEEQHRTTLADFI